jgi:hypothetical protein
LAPLSLIQEIIYEILKNLSPWGCARITGFLVAKEVATKRELFGRIKLLWQGVFE